MSVHQGAAMAERDERRLAEISHLKHRIERLEDERDQLAEENARLRATTQREGSA